METKNPTIHAPLFLRGISTKLHLHCLIPKKNIETLVIYGNLMTSDEID